jgi:hypothetical protein
MGKDGYEDLLICLDVAGLEPCHMVASHVTTDFENAYILAKVSL